MSGLADRFSTVAKAKISRLLDRAEANVPGLEEWQRANLREMRRERDQAIATPQNLVSRLARATSRAEIKWLEAKQKSDFGLFAPHLEEVVNLLRDKARLLAGMALDAAPDTLEWSNGAWVGAGDELKTVEQIALYAHGSGALPPGVEGGLDAQTVYRD